MTKRIPSSLRPVLPPLLTIVLLVAISGVAMSATSPEDESAARVVKGDGPVAGTVHTVREEADSRSGRWGVRVFRNQRSDRCADVGLIAGEDLTVKIGSSRRPIPAGEDGVCAPAASPVVLGSKSMPDGELPRTVFFGTVDAGVETVEVSFHGETQRVTPTGNDHAVLAVFDATTASTPPPSSEDQLNDKYAEKLLSRDIPSAVLVFGDGSRLALRSPNAQAPERGTEADAARRRIAEAD